MRIRTLLFAVLLVVSPLAHARHMEGRTGFGLSLHDFNNTPCLSMRYHLSDYQAAEVGAGFDTDDSRKVFVVGAKFYQAAHLEENITFYVGLGGYLISDKGGTSTTSSGLEFQGLFGSEFFLSGLPNLGIVFETGVALRTVRNVSLSTVGSGFLGGAIHYYF